MQNCKGDEAMQAQNIICKKWFKISLILIMFIPVYTQVKFDPQYTTKVIAEILMNPFAVQIKWVLPIMKALLFIVALIPFVLKKNGEKIILGYYAAVLIVVGIFQNMGNTQYGFSFSIGNLIVQFIIAGVVIADLVQGKSKIERQDFDKKCCWVIPLMALAFLMPYTVKEGLLVPALNTVLINEAGVTYCMLTPVVTGTLLLFNKRIYRPTLNAISFLGFGFGILNMMTWFIFDSPNWWMGICHLPLLIISFFGLRKSKCSKRC